MTEPVDDLAVTGLFGPPAGIDGRFQDPLDVSQFGHPPLDLAEAVLKQGLDFSTRGGRAVAVVEQGRDIIQGEARRLSGAVGFGWAAALESSQFR